MIRRQRQMCIRDSVRGDYYSKRMQQRRDVEASIDYFHKTATGGRLLADLLDQYSTCSVTRPLNRVGNVPDVCNDYKQI